MLYLANYSGQSPSGPQNLGTFLAITKLDKMKGAGILKIAAVLTFVFSTCTLWAQPGPPPTASAPVDGGVALLLIGAASYGYKKIRDRKQQGQ
jgi:hypothetical protein